MSSAYVFTKPTELPALPRLPLLCMAGASGLNLLIERASEGDLPTCQALLNEVLAEGTTYPFEGPMDEAMFRAYFLSHEAFVAKDLAAGSKICGMFYIKPNFPGRCSHICNGGFVVPPQYRGQGVGFALGQAFLLLARDLGYRAVMFNLVFVTNEPSLRLWRRLGFKEIGRIPNAGNLKGYGFTDAIQFYYDLTAPSS